MPTIDDLRIEISDNSKQAVSGIDSLTESLSKLKAITRGGVGLNGVADQFEKLNQALQEFQNPSKKIKKLVAALKPLETIKKTQLNSTVNSLSKLPDITNELANINMDKFESQIKRVALAMKPLADEMNKIAAGFQSLPKQMRDFLSESEKVGRGTNKTARAFGGLNLRLGLSLVALRQLYHKMGEWVQESNSYVENLNLFRVTMRDTSDEALVFAERVHDAFGIDPSEWMRFQAVFQNMLTGFGVMNDTASVMSRNLTQLGYDLATIFNVDYSVAMRKLESAIAGQPRPMREWGFDMSESTLKLVALNNGIQQNVETMTQYEKSQLRYIQLMQTAEKQGILGNFAREIHTPANAFRILNQQLVQFKRALGNMIIPILMKILPYLQAFVVVLTDIARALANLLGFTLPIIDYSGIGDNFGAIGDEADKANDSVSKLKNSLMGFDELNILSRSSGTGGIGGIGSGFEIDPSLYDYDFLGEMRNQVNDLVDAFYEKIQPVIQYIKDNFNHIKDVASSIGAGLLTWRFAKGVEWLFGLFQNKMSPTLGIALIIGGVTLAVSGLSNIVSGSADVMDYVKTAVGSALGIATSFITLGTGPAGWVMAIATTVAITVEGVKLSIEKSIGELIDTVLGTGDTSIVDISNAFSEAMEKIWASFDPVIESGQQIKEHAKHIETSKNNIQTLFNVINSGAGDSVGNLDKIAVAMGDILNETQLLRDKAYGNIIHALSTSFVNVEKTVGESAENIIRDILLIKNEGDERLTEAQIAIRNYQKAWQEGSLSTSEYIDKVTKKYDELYGTTTILDDVRLSFEEVMYTLKNINWEDEADRSKAIKEIAKSAQNASGKIEEYFEAISDSYEYLLQDITDPELREKMTKAFVVLNDANRKEAEGEIIRNLELLHGAINLDLTKRIAGIGYVAEKEWEEAGILQGLLGYSAAVPETFKQFERDVIAPLETELQDAFKEFGYTGEVNLRDSIDYMFKEGFIFPKWFSVNRFTGDLDSVLKKIVEEAEKKVNKNPLSLKIKANVDISANTSALIAMQKGTRGYAGGGFPPEGQIFMARENGPELVGNIGGRTAVVNNDQIVESVSAGVAKAVSSVIGRSSGESGDIVIQVNEMELGRISRSAINKYNKVTGNMALEL